MSMITGKVWVSYNFQITLVQDVRVIPSGFHIHYP